MTCLQGIPIRQKDREQALAGRAFTPGKAGAM
jgi:hypothetical protein